MIIQADFWHLLGLLLSFIGVLTAFGRVMLDKLDKRLDGINERVMALEKEVSNMKASMPLEYQRREDAIRFETVLNAKLDAIGGRIERLVEKSA